MMEKISLIGEKPFFNTFKQNHHRINDKIPGMTMSKIS